jgi:hypothetical protein
MLGGASVVIPLDDHYDNHHQQDEQQVAGE